MEFMARMFVSSSSPLFFKNQAIMTLTLIRLAFCALSILRGLRSLSDGFEPKKKMADKAGHHLHVNDTRREGKEHSGTQIVPQWV